jgi:quercetin dioxygenase-like cupin family protein
LFSLVDEFESFAQENASGRYARTLLKTPRLRVVLTYMEAGIELREHTAPGPITIQPIRGRFTVTADNDEVTVAPDSVLAIDANVRHSVRAEERGVFLLTIAWSGDGSHVTDEEG